MAATQTEHTDLPETRSSMGAGVVEALASGVSLFLVAALTANWFAAHLTFFGDPVVIDDEDVRNYWVIVGLLSATLLATWVGAVRRGASGAWIWHGLVAAAAVGAAVVFAVTTPGPVVHEPHPPAPHHSGPVCYGTSGDCPGG